MIVDKLKTMESCAGWHISKKALVLLCVDVRARVYVQCLLGTLLFHGIAVEPLSL